MKVAIFHDYIGSIGGAERLVLTLARALRADVITTDFDENALISLGFQDVKVISLGPLIQKTPIKQVHASLKFFYSDLPGYDFYIFSGNWAHYAAYRHKPNLWYCHTPVRIFYDLRKWILGRQKNPFLWFTVWIWISVHGWFDRQAARQVDAIITNSKNTQDRIRRFYSAEAKIIYPPIPVTKFRFIESGEFWLSVNRLYPEKRIHLQIEAFRGMPGEQLKIAGGHPDKTIVHHYLGNLSDLPPGVTILGSVTDEELADLYGRCRGFVATAIDEDFGMAPVEAMSAGKPVVAVREGGYCESVLDGVTGKLVDADPESISQGVQDITRKGCESFRDDCRKRAELFDERIFEAKMREQIGDLLRLPEFSASIKK